MRAGLITILLFLLCDLARLDRTGERVDLGVLATVVFWAIAPVLTCAIVAWVATRLWRGLRRHGWTNRYLAALVIGAAAAGPAYYVGKALTQGSGIRASGWAGPVCHAVDVGLPLAFAALTLLWPRLRAAPLLRLFAGGALGCAGLAGMLLLAYHPVTYMEAHRGVLLLATVLLLCALALLLGSPAGRGLLAVPISHPRFLLISAALALVSASVVFTHSRLARFRIAATVFRGTLVAQKLHPLWLAAAQTASPPRIADLDSLRSPAPKRSARQRRWRGHDIVIVTADAMRADVIDAGDTPTLAWLRERAWAFDEAIADYSHTARALPTLIHGISVGGQRKFPSRKSALRRFQAAGYTTLAITNSGRAAGRHFHRSRFPWFMKYVAGGPTCDSQVEAFRTQLAEASGPMLTWLHFFDTHTPLGYGRDLPRPDDPPVFQYATAVGQIDTCLKATIAALRAAKRWRRTILVFTADHGESLGEHQRMLQHSTCYAHDLRVPLLIRLPNDSAGAPPVRVQTSDILPTLASLTGVKLKPRSGMGRDFSALLAPGVAPRPTDMRRAWSEGFPLQFPCTSLMEDQWHLVYSDRGKHYELYDVERDPRERRDVLGKNAAVFWRMKALVDQRRMLSEQPR